VSARAERRGQGPAVWDWLTAALAVVSMLALPVLVFLAVTTIVAQPDALSAAQALVYVGTGAAWAWWMGVGSWRVTYWAKRAAAARVVPAGGPVGA
jgi:hypothetical protein